MGFVANYLRNIPATFLGRQPRHPLLFSYYLTHRCDLNCFYCCDGDGKRFKEDPVNELSTFQAKKLITMLRKETDTIDFTGGEPLIRNDLEELLGHSQKLGFRTVLNTKGLGIENRPRLISLSDVLVISLDSLDAENLGRTVGRSTETGRQLLSSLSFVLSNIRRSKTSLILSCVASPDNLLDVEKVLDFAVENGLGFQISPEIVGVKVNSRLSGNPGYSRLIKRALRLKLEGHPILGVRQYFRGIVQFSPFPCYPLLMPVIRPDGKMYYPCLESKCAEINLLEEPDYAAALRNIRKKRGEIPTCTSCCHIFCHMAISLLQYHPISAFKEMKNWRCLNA